MQCVICNHNFEDEKNFNKHLRKHHLTIKQYYHTHFPRYDMFDKKLIEFKDSEQYFFDSFNSKANLHSWLKANQHRAHSFLVEILRRYADSRELKKAPHSVELRSINCLPSTKIFDLFFTGGYKGACKEAGIDNKLIYEPIKLQPFNELNIIIDTREQTPWVFPKNVFFINEKLDFGDYALASRKSKLVIERKNLSDLIGTLAGGYERFTREIERAEEAGFNLVVMVEENIFSAMSFNHNPDMHCQVTPDFIFHKIRRLCRSFDNIQFVFVNSPKQAMALACQILSNSDTAFSYDLQYQLDKGWL